jgi:hypothetical protein
VGRPTIYTQHKYCFALRPCMYQYGTHCYVCALPQRNPFSSVAAPSPSSPPSSPAALLCSGDPLLEQQLRPLHRAAAVVCRGPPSACFHPPLLSVQRLNRRVGDHSSVVYSLDCCATADENRRRRNNVEVIFPESVLPQL